MIKMKKENGILRSEAKSVEDIYTPLSVAKEEVWRRWNDKKLRKKVEDFFNGEFSDCIEGKPKAYLGRHIASPDLEMKHFVGLSKEIGLSPVVIEYKNDKLALENLDKYHLAKMYFHNGNGKNGGNKISVLKVVDLNKFSGKTFKEVDTLWGENFVTFHHRILNYIFPAVSESLRDVSGWISSRSVNNKLDNFYIYYLGLSICGGVFFENFLTNKEEKEFTSKIVIPSFNKLTKIFGVRPLIVPIAPRDDEANIYWWCYPEVVKDLCIKEKV